jgi:hypothetical protein
VVVGNVAGKRPKVCNTPLQRSGGIDDDCAFFTSQDLAK